MQRLHSTVAADLDGPVGRQVVPELAQVLPVVVFQDEDGVPGVLLHVVGKVREHGVDPILQGLDPAEQGDLLLVVLKGDEWDAGPVKFLGLPSHVHGEVILMLPQLYVRDELAVLEEIPPQAVVLEQFHPLHDLLCVAVPDLLSVVAQSTVQRRVVVVGPEGQDVIGWEMLKGQLTLPVIIGVEPAQAAIQGVLADVFQQPPEAAAEHLAQLGRVSLVPTVHRDGLAHQIVCLLVYHQSVLIVHDPVVG